MLDWHTLVLAHSLLLAFVTSELARSYGRPRGPWFIGGFIFGELTLIGLLLSKRRD